LFENEPFVDQGLMTEAKLKPIAILGRLLGTFLATMGDGKMDRLNAIVLINPGSGLGVTILS
jgi:hypothetical protein